MTSSIRLKMPSTKSIQDTVWLVTARVLNSYEHIIKSMRISKKYSDIFSLALSISRKHIKNTRNSIHKIMWLLSLYSPKASIYSKWKLLFPECFYSVKYMYLSRKKYNIMKLKFSIFVYFIMFTKDLRIYFIFLPILLYIRYVHVN